MLTRGLLDHVPPIFGKAKFNEVANNYSGGGRSFKETMHHLENASRKVADAHLIRLLRIAVEQHKSSVGTRNLAEGPAAAAASLRRRARRCTVHEPEVQIGNFGLI